MMYLFKDLELPSCEPPLCCHVDHNREGLEPPTTGTRKQVLVSACGQTRACMRRSKHNLKCLRFCVKDFQKVILSPTGKVLSTLLIVIDLSNCN